MSAQIPKIIASYHFYMLIVVDMYFPIKHILAILCNVVIILFFFSITQMWVNLCELLQQVYFVLLESDTYMGISLHIPANMLNSFVSWTI